MTSFFPISKNKVLGKIRVRKQNRNLNSIPEPWGVVGLDTETDKGDIFLISDSDGNYLDLNDITFENIAKFLLKYEGKTVVFYNLQYDAECILKLLPKEILKSYRWKKELKFSFGKYDIFYIDRKKLTISKGNHSVSCYDIAQYYEGKSLDSAYVDNIKKTLKPEYLELKKKRRQFSRYYYSRNKKAVRNYCRKDCILTKELAIHWIKLFHDTFEFYTPNLISSGYLAEKVLINNDIYIPRFNESPYQAQELAWSSFYGGRFELVKRSSIGKCYLYDINSAYPYALTQIPDITNGRWTYSKRINKKAKLGFFLIQADVDDTVKIAPFPFRKKNGTICYPTGKFITHVTLHELLAVKGDPKIKYKILDACQFIPSNNCTCPFKDFIESQYNRRMNLKEKNIPLERAIKIILNSMYGKMAQRTNNVMGNLFNPIIASSITGYTRAYLYSFMKEHNLDNYTVAFATDSIACQQKIEGLDSKELGKMKLDKQADDVIFLSNGFYKFNGVWKNRGIGYDHERKIEIEHLDTHVNKDGQLYIKVKSTRTTHIKSGILYNRLNDIGKIEPYEKKINLNSDKKRYWDSDLESLNDGSMCDSVPIPADIMGELISNKEELEWFYDDERYEPESDL